MGDEAAEWEATYRGAKPEQLPWFTDRLDPDIESQIEALRLPPASRVLDVGTGPGTAAIHAARLGYDVTAIDISSSAIEMARSRAGPLASRIHWVAADVLAAHVKGPFDLALDRGLFHTLPDAVRGPYARRLEKWLSPGGHLILKVFSDEEPPGWGPRRVSREEIETTFEPAFMTRHWERTRFPGAPFERGHEPKAYLFVLERP